MNDRNRWRRDLVLNTFRRSRRQMDSSGTTQIQTFSQKSWRIRLIWFSGFPFWFSLAVLNLTLSLTALFCFRSLSDWSSRLSSVDSHESIAACVVYTNGHVDIYGRVASRCRLYTENRDLTPLLLHFLGGGMGVWKFCFVLFSCPSPWGMPVVCRSFFFLFFFRLLNFRVCVVSLDIDHLCVWSGCVVFRCQCTFSGHRTYLNVWDSMALFNLVFRCECKFCIRWILIHRYLHFSLNVLHI